MKKVGDKFFLTQADHLDYTQFESTDDMKELECIVEDQQEFNEPGFEIYEVQVTKIFHPKVRLVEDNK
jgi:hypothetical protein